MTEDDVSARLFDSAPTKEPTAAKQIPEVVSKCLFNIVDC